MSRRITRSSTRQIDEDSSRGRGGRDRTSRSRSPIYDNKLTIRSRIRSPIVKKNIVQRTGNNTPILFTPFTFGMEWESNPYFTHKREKHYDRETIFKSDSRKLVATLEDFKTSNLVDEKITNKQDKDGCKYALEIAIGVLGKDPNMSIENFIMNDKIFIPEIEKELSDFRENFLERKKENIRILHIRGRSDKVAPESFGDCSLSIPITEENKMNYPYMYTKDIIYSVDSSGQIKVTESDVNDIEGRPQATVGLSYALFIPLLESYKGDNKIDYTFSVYENIMSDQSVITLLNSIDINNRFVFLGFSLLIVYYCTLASIYSHKSVSVNYNIGQYFPYFKSIFHLKPRSNLAESYKHLKAEYDYFDEFINLLYTTILPSKIPFVFDPSQISDYISLIEYQLKYIKYEASDDVDIIRRLDDNLIYTGDITSKYEDIILFMETRGYHKYNNIMYTIIIINIIYLIYRILNPKKVVKLRINRDKIGKDCKFLDGYYYSYEEDSKNVIDELVLENYAEIMNDTVYDFAHTSDPQVLVVEKTSSMDIKSICPSAREELFEYIPEDSNLIVELRYPEHFTKNYNSHLSFKDIKNFLSEIFSDINNIFKDFIQTYILVKSKEEPEVSQQVSYQEPEPSKKQSQYCSIMFRPKSKKTRKGRK